MADKTLRAFGVSSERHSTLAYRWLPPFLDTLAENVSRREILAKV